MIANIPDAMVRDSIRMLAQNTFFSNTRYSYALSNDLNAEQLFYFNPTHYLNITTGVNVNATIGLSQINYLAENYNNIDLVHYNYYRAVTTLIIGDKNDAFKRLKAIHAESQYKEVANKLFQHFFEQTND